MSRGSVENRCARSCCQEVVATSGADDGSGAGGKLGSTIGVQLLATDDTLAVSVLSFWLDGYRPRNA